MYFTRETYQGGSLTRKSRAKGDVWIYRWREAGPTGKRVQRKIIVGTIRELKSKAAAHKELATMNLQINTNQPRRGPINVTELIAHYTAKELGEKRKSKAEYTCRVYGFNLRNHIEPRWGTRRADSINAPEVEDWLSLLSLSNGMKAKLRNNMSAVWNHGIRHQLLCANPITGNGKGSGVRQSSTRSSVPIVLTADEIRRGLAELSRFFWTMILVIATTGLRPSELRGLKNEDLDVERLVLNLKRGFVKKHVGEMKNNASRRPVPITPEVCRALQELRSDSPYPGDGDWMFPSVAKRGTIPVWSNSALVNHIRPAFARAGVGKHVCWKTFRTSYATLLKGNGEDVKTVQESLRHSTSAITMDVYTQAIPSAMRKAQLRVASAFGAERGPKIAVVPGCSQIGGLEAVSC